MDNDLMVSFKAYELAGKTFVVIPKQNFIVEETNDLYLIHEMPKLSQGVKKNETSPYAD